MKRLLAYLFIVLGLGLVVSVNAKAEEAKFDDYLFCKYNTPNKVLIIRKK